ncbi:MAG: PepSY-associated TM helix domain-containing protein [Calditrichaceae bacterium]|nr:PepSY-associated TM helix domain-containing protein [Calditrichia bacterium]NUQ43420.1 PepSY-associated TM helix domain-containing protein [Calditrichaceae bacterium]
MKKSNWRKWNRAIHRDLGYICAGLTLIYAISGVAVNHVQDWNPNYKIERTTAFVGPVEHYAEDTDDALAREVLRRLGLPGEYKNTFRPDPETLRIFAGNRTIQVNLRTGEAAQEIVRTRPLIYQTNFLHLNHPKRLWTYFADLYAVALALLAVTGLFILRGKQGITGRGAWLTAIGILLPLFFLWLYS